MKLDLLNKTIKSFMGSSFFDSEKVISLARFSDIKTIDILETENGKGVLYNAVVKRYEERNVFLTVDTHIVVLYQLFRDIITPLFAKYESIN